MIKKTDTKFKDIIYKDAFQKKIRAALGLTGNKMSYSQYVLTKFISIPEDVKFEEDTCDYLM